MIDLNQLINLVFTKVKIFLLLSQAVVNGSIGSQSFILGASKFINMSYESFNKI